MSGAVACRFGVTDLHVVCHTPLEIKRRFKTTDESVDRMCELIEHYRAEGCAEGREQRRTEGRYEIVADMLRDGMNIDMVVRIAKMTIEQVIAIGKNVAVL